MKKRYIDVYSQDGSIMEKNDVDIKCILKSEPKFLILKNNSIMYELENIQTLYLYPLTLLDYVSNINSKNIISINIINIDSDVDYIKVFCDDIFDELKSVEILLKDTYSEKQYERIYKLLEYLYDRKVKVSLNIKNLNCIPLKFLEYYKFVSCFKVFLSNILDTSIYDEFKKKLEDINKNRSLNSLLYIKTYLNLEEVYYYRDLMKDFSKFNVDIFQVSKELLPFNLENVDVDIEVQKIVRDLEKDYNDYNNTKFISVRDISTLYYPRFELDDRNSRRCYACRMKPYMYSKNILPCKVKRVMDDLDKWSVNYNDIEKYNNLIVDCGVKCDDCASIFENDVLNEIEKIIEMEGYDNLSFFLDIGDQI